MYKSLWTFFADFSFTDFICVACQTQTAQKKYSKSRLHIKLLAKHLPVPNNILIHKCTQDFSLWKENKPPQNCAKSKSYVCKLCEQNLRKC